MLKIYSKFHYAGLTPYKDCREAQSARALATLLRKGFALQCEYASVEEFGFCNLRSGLTRKIDSVYNTLSRRDKEKITMKKRIGIFGGAFDPPHIGHIEAIRSVLVARCVDEVWVLPAGRRVEKKMASSPKDRLAMCILMVEENFGHDAPVAVKDDQVWSDHPSFSIDIITDFKHRYPDYDFYLVVGDDVVPDIPNWKEGEKLLETVPFLIIERNHSIKEGVPRSRIWDGCKKFFASYRVSLRKFVYRAMKRQVLHASYRELSQISLQGVRLPKNYVILPRLVEMSSTIVRTLCKEEKDFGLYVPRAVGEYIKKGGLYRKEKRK